MRLTIFGASGNVGRLVVKECLSRGHTVVAFTHSSNSLPNERGLPHPEKLRVVQGDVHDLGHVAEALQGSEAVICTLGSWGSKSRDVVAAGISAIIPAMKHHHIERIVTLTGAEAHDEGDKPTIMRNLAHTAANVAAGRILHDGEEHIRLLRESGLDWTTLRSPVMTNQHEIFYTLTLTPRAPWQTVPRIAVAKALVDQVEGPAYSHAAPFIYRQTSRFA